MNTETDVWDGIANNETPGRLGETSPEETLSQEFDSPEFGFDGEPSHRDESTSPAVRANNGPRIVSQNHGRGKHFRDASGGVADAAGLVTIQFDGPQEGYDWMVERIFIKFPGAAATVADIFTEDASDGFQVDAATDARKTVADQNHPIYVPSRKPLIVKGTGLTVGASAVVTIQGKRIATETDS